MAWLSRQYQSILSRLSPVDAGQKSESMLLVTRWNADIESSFLFFRDTSLWSDCDDRAVSVDEIDLLTIPTAEL
jgi:hypothetical protein